MSAKAVDILKDNVDRGIFPSELYKYRELGRRTYGIIQSATMWFSRVDSLKSGGATAILKIQKRRGGAC